MGRPALFRTKRADAQPEHPDHRHRRVVGGRRRLCVLVSATVQKNPVKVAAGRAGAAVRWGVPVRVRLDDFDADERSAILLAIEAKRAAKRVRAERGATPEAAA
jgi:hypothetical protein